METSYHSINICYFKIFLSSHVKSHFLFTPVSMATGMACRNSNASVLCKYFNRNRSKRFFSAEVKSKYLVESAPEIPQKIIIPQRIHRGPTDILKALASTIQKDYTAAKYKYEDDPYFIPISNVSKRSFALSKESGKKAARYFLENYPHFFQVNKSDPLIKAYEPPKIYTEKDNVTEETLKSCIESFEVTNSLTVYELLKKKDMKVSEDVKQALLELLCFHNCSQPPPEDYYEEKWFAFKDRSRQNTWKPNNQAEKLFEEMEPKTGAAYCAMIQGCAKFFSIERAMVLHDEMCSKNLEGSTDMYNSLLELVPYIKSDGESRWELAMHYVQKMNADNVQPNLATMNALMSIASKSRRWSKARTLCTKLLGEMKKMNIEPSIGTYYHVLTIFCINSAGYSRVLSQILSKIGIQEFSIRHPDDVMFFTLAMEVCSLVSKDKGLAYHLNELLEYRNNCVFLGSSLLESLYFKHFFNLLCEMEEFDKFMEIYERYVPHTYTPEASVMLKIVTSLEFAMAYHHLPKICSDVMLFEHSERENVLKELLAVISNATLGEKENNQLVTLMWDMITKIFKRSENIYKIPFQWSAELLSNAMKIFLNGNDLEKAWFILEKMKAFEETIVDYTDNDVFVQFCSAALAAKDFDKLEFCVKFTSANQIPSIKEKVLKIANSMFEEHKQLQPNEKLWVDELFEFHMKSADVKSNKQRSEGKNGSNENADVKSSNKQHSEEKNGDSKSDTI